jgi:uncharacterized protein (DUF302 family)
MSRHEENAGYASLCLGTERHYAADIPCKVLRQVKGSRRRRL